MNKMTLWYQNKNLSIGGWNRTFKSSVFDTYNHPDCSLTIYHRSEKEQDVFSVECMFYEYKGCWVGTSQTFGKFSTFEEAIACAHATQLPEDKLTQMQAVSA